MWGHLTGRWWGTQSEDKEIESKSCRVERVPHHVPAKRPVACAGPVP